MARKIQGITIEIGGDTRKLNTALKDINKEIKATQKELKEVEKALELDPENIILTEQKQRLLAKSAELAAQKEKMLQTAAEKADEALAKGKAYDEKFKPLQSSLDEVTKKLSNMRSESENMSAALESGAISTEKYEQFTRTITELEARSKELRREIASLNQEFSGDIISQRGYDQLQRDLVWASAATKKAENAMDGLKDAVEETGEAAGDLDQLGDSIDSAGSGYAGLGDIIKGTAIGGLIQEAAMMGVEALKGLALWIVNLDEATADYRAEMGKLNTAYETAGLGAEVAQQAYTGLYTILGDSGTATEAAQLLAKIAQSAQDVSVWTDIAAGAYGTFGDALPINSLIESANETANTGKVVGVLADALNWAGISEDDFNAKLQSLGTTTERTALITDTLISTYSEAANAFRENNQAVIEARENQVLLDNAMAQLGESVSLAKTALMSELAPVLADIAEKFSDMIGRVDWQAFGAELAAFIDGIDFDAVFGSLELILKTLLNLVSTATNFLTIIGPLIEPVLEHLNHVLWVIQFLTSAAADLGQTIRGALGFGGTNRTGGGFGGGGRSIREASLPGFAQGGVFAPNSPMLGVLGDNRTEIEVAAPESTLKNMFTEALDARGIGGGNAGANTVVLQFNGSLAQLARMLKPELDTESKLRGVNLVTRGRR